MSQRTRHEQSTMEKTNFDLSKLSKPRIFNEYTKLGAQYNILLKANKDLVELISALILASPTGELEISQETAKKLGEKMPELQIAVIDGIVRIRFKNGVEEVRKLLGN